MIGIYILAYFLCIIDLLFVAKKNNEYIKRSRIHNLISVIVLILVFLLITSNRSGDIVNYRKTYILHKRDYLNREIVYSLLNHFFYSVGVDFYVFRAILTGTVMVLGTIAFLYFEVNVCYIMIFYLPITLFWDAMLLKNSLSLWLLLFATVFLVNHDIKGNTLYILMLLMISGIHNAFLFYIPLGMISKNAPKVKRVLIFFIFFLISAITLVNNNRIPFIKSIFTLILSDNDSRIRLYDTSGNWGFLYPMIVHIIVLLGLEYLVQKNNEYVENTRKKAFINFVRNMNYVTLFIVPFLMMNIVFYRFFENAFFFNTIAYGLLIRRNGLAKGSVYKSNVVNIVFLTIISMFWIVFNLQIYTNIEWIVKPVLIDGIFFWR